MTRQIIMILDDMIPALDRQPYGNIIHRVGNIHDQTYGCVGIEFIIA